MMMLYILTTYCHLACLLFRFRHHKTKVHSSLISMGTYKGSSLWGNETFLPVSLYMNKRPLMYWCKYVQWITSCLQHQKVDHLYGVANKLFMFSQFTVCLGRSRSTYICLQHEIYFKCPHSFI